MYQLERMQSILEYVKNNKRISVDEICSLYDVSKDTARRDLVELEKTNLIVRTHGGAILPITHTPLKGYDARLSAVSDKKRLIGSLAASLVKDGDIVIMDTSTTVQAAAEVLQVNYCTVVTNSIDLAQILSVKAGIEIHLLGGRLDHKHKFLSGPATITMLSNFFADKVFIGAHGITERGLTLDAEDNAFVTQKMIEQSKQVIALADHSKFVQNGFCKVADLNKLDLIITDREPDEQLMNIFEHNGIEIMITENI